MKRPAVALVSYPSSEEESSEAQAKSEPTKRRKKLPQLSSSLVVPVPVDNPALHQGRKRTTPHVDGQYAAFVYVSLALSRNSLLYLLLQDILTEARKCAPSLHNILHAKDEKEPLALHVSISRPIFLRAHQREELKTAVRKIARAHKPFKASFATFSELINDEKTRTFLTMQIGAGYHELSALSNALAPALKAIRQQEYYTNPIFHASIAWALLQGPDETRPSSSPPLDSICTPDAAMLDSPTSNASVNAVQEGPFPTVSQLPPEMITSLNERYGERLASSRIGVFDVGEIRVKIGKSIFLFPLVGG